jgi:hypothetical protein
VKKIAWGVAALAAVLIIGGLWFSGDTPGAKAGDCASISGSAEQPEFHALDCGSDRANVKVAKVIEPGGLGCPATGAAYSTYAADVTLCLMPNFVEGSCYGQDEQSGIAKVPCGTPGSVRVAKAVSGKVGCGDNRAVSFPEPATTFCLAEGGA